MARRKSLKSRLKGLKRTGLKTVKSLKRTGKGLLRAGRSANKQFKKWNKQRKGGRQIAEGAFIATMPNEYKGVFKRLGKARLPIEQLFGPSIADLVDLGSIETSIGNELNLEMNKQVDLLLKGN